jgi:hypothetical protein
MNRRGTIDPGPDEAGRSVLTGKHGGQGAAQAGAGQRAFPDHHDDLAPAAPVLRQTEVLAINLPVCRPDVATDITAVDLNVPPGASRTRRRLVLTASGEAAGFAESRPAAGF